MSSFLRAVVVAVLVKRALTVVAVVAVLVQKYKQRSILILLKQSLLVRAVRVLVAVVREQRVLLVPLAQMF
jgi:hypothetical protein